MGGMHRRAGGRGWEGLEPRYFPFPLCGLGGTGDVSLNVRKRACSPGAAHQLPLEYPTGGLGGVSTCPVRAVGLPLAGVVGVL